MNRTDVLNHLVTKHSLKRYLEIGVQVPEINFDKIKCEYKISVDPDHNARATFCMTSDEYFNEVEKIKSHSFAPSIETAKAVLQFDLVFIDGLHTAEQVKKDFENALKILSPNGFIVLHDCNPEKEEHTIVPRPTKTGHWNGDVYRFAAAVSHNGKFTVDVDNGCMVCPEKDKDQILYESFWDWNLFNNHRKYGLNLITWDEFIKL